MAFIVVNQTDRNANMGKHLVRFGTYENTAGSTGGEVTTGLTQVVAFFANDRTGANAIRVNETLPLDGGDVTIVTTADDDGHWMAVGL